MTGPVNGAARINGISALKIECAQNARKMVAGWVAAMKEHSMSALVFSCPTAMNDSGAFVWGYVDRELRDAGYVVASHSDMMLPSQDGTLMVMRTVLVRSVDGEAKRVLLA